MGEKNIVVRPKRRFRMRELTILISVAVCAAVFGLLNPRFIGLEPAQAILTGASTDGLVVIGMAIVIICGGFDLSVGSTMAAAALVTALLMKSGCNVPLAVLAGLLSGALIGWTNGSIVTKLKINPFITTLGTMSIIRGIVLVVTKGSPPSGFPHGFQQIAWGNVFGIPLPIIILLAVTISADFLLRKLRYLRQVYFVGSNEDAASLTGIDVGAVKNFAFVITGILAALAGIIIASRGNAVDPNEGLGAELRVIAAVIVGGASLSGGRGTILGAFLGLLLMQVITTGLVFINVAPESQLIAVGIVLIFAAIIDRAGTSLGKDFIALLTTTRSKKMERIINVGLGIALIVVLITRFGISGREEPSRASVHGPSKSQHYVMVALGTGNSYWIDSKAGLADKAAELGVEATFTGPTTGDANQQIDAINRAIAQKVDGIIAVPVSDQVTPIINEAIGKGIPVVCCDTDAPSSKRYSFVGTGNYSAGLMGGESLANLIGGKGQIVILSVPGQENLESRVKGYLDALKKFPGIKVAQMGNDQNSASEAQKVCRTILQAHPDLAGFACVDAAGGEGAAVAVKEAGKVGKVKIVAMDRNEPTLRAIDDGIIDISIAQRTYTMTYTALQMLYNVRNNQVKLVKKWREADINPLPPSVDTGSFLITKKNVKLFFRDEQK